MDKEKMRGYWRKASKKYYARLKKEEPEKHKEKVKGISRRIYRYRFGGNREAVLQRDNFWCRICCSKKRIVVHHIDGNGRGNPPSKQNNSMDNLICLCQKCHNTIQNFAQIKNSILANELVEKYPIK